MKVSAKNMVIITLVVFFITTLTSLWYASLARREALSWKIRYDNVVESYEKAMEDKLNKADTIKQ